jgi:uncharacterized protein YkwD
MLNRVLELTNQERQNAGFAPLSVSSELTSAAQAYSQVLATSGCFAHTCGPVPNVGDRVGQAGYNDWTTVGENIAAGFPSPDEVFSVWMNSPGHRANLLSPWYTEIGLGVAGPGGPDGTWWTQDFGARRGAPLSMPMAQLTPPADDQ